ncbi:hypothetical protein ABZ345_29860 [Lentzea sp. NPDC005914]|uniref:hypothetical protein n=1 Tax=Lentzea sp. NPDC005914 TaxID=3154572 RepID=UPI0033C5B7A0
MAALQDIHHKLGGTGPLEAPANPGTTDAPCPVDPPGTADALGATDARQPR